VPKGQTHDDLSSIGAFLIVDCLKERFNEDGAVAKPGYGATTGLTTAQPGEGSLATPLTFVVLATARRLQRKRRLKSK
jgi:hypothetical protein